MDIKSCDVLIVGQGIAGTCLAFQFIQLGKEIIIIDNELESTASLVASGIINPITGRHFVKTWEFDRLWAYLLDFYPDMEALIGDSIFEKLKIYRSLPSAKEYNDWMMRSDDPEIHNLLSSEQDLIQFKDFYTTPEFSTAILGGRVNSENMIMGFRRLMKEQESFVHDNFDYNQLKIENNHVYYKNFKAQSIVFCEGYKAINNPFFSYLPFKPFKGEVLIYESLKSLPPDILKNDLFFVPLSENQLWVGTKNSHLIDTEHPAEDSIDILMKKANKCLLSGFEFKKARGGIRPSVKDRRPLLGVHKDYSNMYVFNGLGSKGASLAPYLSKRCCDFVINKSELPPEVDINRFLS